jgi:hypothetical protein
MRAICRTRRLHIYNGSGTETAFQFSQNPADVFAFLVRRNCSRLGLNYQNFIDWDYYLSSRAFYAAQIATDAGAKIPKNPYIQGMAADGSIPQDEYFFRVVAYQGASLSSPSVEVTANIPANGRIVVEWDDVAGADGYRLYVRAASETTYTKYVNVTSASGFNLTSLAEANQTEALSELATGSWAATGSRFEANLWFTSPPI